MITTKSSYHLPPHKVITILSAIFPTLYISSLGLFYFITGSLSLLTSLTYFSHPTTPLPSGNHLFVLCIYDSVSVLCLFFFFFFLKIPHISEIIQCLSFNAWLISLSIIPSRFIQVVTNDKILFFFYGWVIFHCMYVPHLLYPFICDGHLGCFCILAIVHTAAMTIGVLISFQNSVFVFFVKMPGSGIAA